MIHIANDGQRRAFSHWLRTGRLPPVCTPDGIELKFNPWHDPDDGRFTFAGSGNHFGVGEGGAGEGPQSGRAGKREPRIVFRDDAAELQIKTKTDADAWRAEKLARYGGNSDNRRTIETKYQAYLASLKPVSASPPTRAATADTETGDRLSEFATGVGEGAYGVANDTAKGLYSVATTNPATTVRGIRDGIVDKIDRALAAEDTPARVQMARAADAITNASARDIGRAVGSTAGNLALATVPGAALSKVSMLRRSRLAVPHKVRKFPEVRWPKENLNKEQKLARQYNDAAPGARPGYAPALKRTDGSNRWVKFDGIRGDYLIDRKWSVYRSKKAQDQALRQSEVLAEHNLIGVWELPTEAKRAEAVRFLRKLNIRNIKPTVVKPW